YGQITGRPSHLDWSFGDGQALTNTALLGLGHSWTNVGDYSVTFTAFNTAYPQGVSTNLMVHVIPLVSPTMTGRGLDPNRFSVQFTGRAGLTYALEQTTNLVPPAVWTTVGYQFSTGGVSKITDSQATNAMRFYRVRAL